MNLDSNVVIDIDDINVADKNSCLIIDVKHGNDLSPKLLSWINILIYGLEGCRFIMAMCTYVDRRLPSSNSLDSSRIIAYLKASSATFVPATLFKLRWRHHVSRHRVNLIWASFGIVTDVRRCYCCQIQVSINQVVLSILKATNTNLKSFCFKRLWVYCSFNTKTYFLKMLLFQTRPFLSTTTQ